MRSFAASQNARAAPRYTDQPKYKLARRNQGEEAREHVSQRCLERRCQSPENKIRRVRLPKFYSSKMIDMDLCQFSKPLL